jgi:O-antigen/teichoic acid export membrane protein
MAASLSLPGGLSSAASKFIAFHRGRGDGGAARGAYRWLTAAGIASALGLGAVVALVAQTLSGVTTADALAAGALTAVFSAYSVAKGALYGFERVVPYTWLEIVGSVVAIGGTIAVIAAGARAYLLPLTVGYAVLMLGSFVVLRRRPSLDGTTGPGQDGGAVAHQTPHHAAPVTPGERWGVVGLATAGGLASAGLLQGLPALAQWITTETEAGYFGAAVVLVGPLYFLPRALSMALFPAMAHAHGAGDVQAVRRQADLSTRALLAVLAPVFAGAILIGRELLLLFGGPEFEAGAAVLQLLLLATFLAVIQVGAVNALSSGDRREVRTPVYSAVAGAVVGVAALVLLGRPFGAAGVAVAYLLGTAIGAAGPIVRAWRRHDMAWAGPLARAVAVVAVGTGVALAVDAGGAGGASRVLLDLALAVVIAGLGAVALRRDLAGVLKAARKS